MTRVPFKELLASVLLLLALGSGAGELYGRVVAVTDGDTVKVLDAQMVQHVVRLNGIDAPESGQAFGQQSKESLSELVFGKHVVVTTHKKDRYGREIGKIVFNGRDVNQEQIRLGMAWFYRRFSAELTPEERSMYDQAESEAKEKNRGLWKDRSPVPPWEYRKSRKAIQGMANPQGRHTIPVQISSLNFLSDRCECLMPSAY